MSVPSRTLVLADLHLVRETPRNVSDDLARLIEAHPGARIVVAGDLFDLSAEVPKVQHRRAAVEALGAHPAARRAIARHVDGGGELWLLGGNHDAEVGTPGFAEHLAGALDLGPEAARRIRSSPWFFRDGAVHFEHGHVYDPDNAPAHPLVKGAPSLGVHFTEEFIAPTGAHRYLQANDGTPLELFVSAFTWYGPRAPYVIYRYFHTAIAAMLRSGPFYRAGSEVPAGEALVDAFAAEVGVPRALVDALADLGARPTLESLASTFARVYFDRVLATIAMASGLGAAALGRRRAGLVVGALGGAAMLASWAKEHDRYAGAVTERLAASAKRVAEATGASLVVLGHTHREALDATYANTGSFAFPRGAPGRPFLEIEASSGAPRAVRRYWAA